MALLPRISKIWNAGSRAARPARIEPCFDTPAPPVPGKESVAGKGRPTALSNPVNLPYDGADRFGQHTQQWWPGLYSGDTTIGWQRDTLVARGRDLVRNDGWAAGTITRTVDSTVGVSMRPLAKPDYRALAHISGNKRFDSVWAAEFASALDAGFRSWANCPGHYNDAERMLTFGQQMGLAFRHLLIDGDALAVLPWMEERVGLGGARYATSCQIIDPDRLSNPNMMLQTENLRNGVEINPETGEPIAYHIREAHQNDWWAAGRSVVWQRYPKDSFWGRPVTIHMFEHSQAGQHRGGAGLLAPVIVRLKMLARYDEAELDAAIVNAVMAAFIETPYDPQSTAEALGTDQSSGPLPGWGDWTYRTAWHEGRSLSLQNSRIPMLAPGEKIGMVTAARPANGFKDFESAVLRNVASAAGLSPMQVSNDWSDVNYSSARGALLEAWKTLNRRKQDFEAGFASPVRMGWVEEAMEVDNLPMPKSGVIPHFLEARAAYGRCKWLGVARGWIDPTKERQGSMMGMEAGLTSLEQECALNEGQDWEEVAEQRARELKFYRERGLPLPAWANAGDAAAQNAASGEDANNSGDGNSGDNNM